LQHALVAQTPKQQRLFLTTQPRSCCPMLSKTGGVALKQMEL
jgi:hypothetical protein